MRYKQSILLLVGVIIVGLSLVEASASSYAAIGYATSQAIQQGLQASNLYNGPTPFLHRPYYGHRSILQRTVSYVDHDKPWYVDDGIFVRYDGKRWTGVSIGSCQGGVNCYDGHNGYDLNLWFEPVLSAAAGTVIRAGWYNATNHESALGLWAAVDHGNGYATAYGHMSALIVHVGDHVGTQWQLGTSGTSGSSTGPHLHMATYYLPNWYATDPFGWSGDYPDPNIVPDHWLWVKDASANGTVPDLSANGRAVYPGATLVDDKGAGWSHTGKWYRSSSPSDIKGSLHWTPTTSGSATATATWQASLGVAGYYEVGVFVDDNHASSGWAPYTVYSADPNHPGTQLRHLVYIDQEHIGSFQGPYRWENTGPQWVSLGTYYFTASLPARVMLTNATGENGLQLAADGVEFAPVAAQDPPAQATPTPTPAPTQITETPTPPASPDLAYRFAVTGDDTPDSMHAGSKTQATLTIENTGNFTWQASGSHAVHVVYRWLDSGGHIVASSDPVVLPGDVAVNATVTVAVSVRAPTVSGSYTLQWDMTQGSLLFSQQGASVHDDVVSVGA